MTKAFTCIANKSLSLARVFTRLIVPNLFFPLLFRCGFFFLFLFVCFSGAAPSGLSTEIPKSANANYTLAPRRPGVLGVLLADYSVPIVIFLLLLLKHDDDDDDDAIGSLDVIRSRILYAFHVLWCFYLSTPYLREGTIG